MRLLLSKRVQTETGRDLPLSKGKPAPIPTICLFAGEAKSQVNRYDYSNFSISQSEFNKL